jgi:hypothetical protein
VLVEWPEHDSVLVEWPERVINLVEWPKHDIVDDFNDEGSGDSEMSDSAAHNVAQLAVITVAGVVALVW